MKEIGSTFRSLREQRGYSISSFDAISLSKAAISKFERGESKMAFDKVISALQFMGVSLAEFEQFFNDYSLGETENLIVNIQSATFKQDKKKLFELQKISLSLGFPVFAIAAKAAFSPLTDEETDQVTQYFYETAFWGYKELCIFYLTMNSISTPDILYILNVFLENGHEIFQVTKFRSYLAQTCCESIAILANRGYKEASRYLLEKLEVHRLINTMYLRNLRNLTQGYWTYLFSNQEDGSKQMDRALEILRKLSLPEVENYYLAKYNKFMQK